MRYVKTIWRSFWLAILFAMLGLFPTLAKGWQSSLSTGTVTVVEHPGPVSNAVTERYTSVSTEVVTVMIYPEPVLPSETVVGAQQDTPPEDIIQSNEQRKFDYYFYAALNAKTLGKYDEALDILLHCHALDSTNANVLVELGTFYSVLQEKNRALHFFKKAVQYDETNYYYNMMLAGLSKELGLKQEVVDIHERMLALYPDKQELHFEMANAYADNGELEKAVASLNELEAQTGITEVLTLNKFRLYSMMDKKEEAFAEIQQIIDKNPTDPRYLVLMAELCMEDNRDDDAIRYLDQAREIDPDFPPLTIALVNYYERTNNRIAAQAVLTRAMTAPSMEVDIKLQLLTRYLAILQQTEQELTQANPLFESLFEQHPNATRLNLIYGSVLMLQENPEGAMEQFEIFARENPDDPAGYEQMLRIAIPEENLDKVVEIATEALKHLPGEPQFYFYLGGAYYQQEKHKEALQVFEEGLEKANFPSPIVESNFHGQIGDLHHFLGDTITAFESYEKALKLDPQNLHVLNNYSYFLSLQKRDLDKAEQMSGITVKLEPMNPTYLDTYGWVLFEQGAYVMAKIYIEKAIEYSKEEPSAEIHEHYGDVLYKSGDPEGAAREWLKAKELGGDSEALNRKIKTGEL